MDSTAYDRLTGRASACLLSGLAVALAVAGCGGGRNDADAARATQESSTVPTGEPVASHGEPPPVEPAWSIASVAGHHEGTVRMGDQDQYADALVAPDGTVRLHLGGEPNTGGGTAARPSGVTLQFAGKVAAEDGLVSGSGRLMAQGCADPSASRLCAGPADATVTLRPAAPRPHAGVKAELRVHLAGEDHRWELDMVSWDSYFSLPAGVEGISGRYRDDWADFGAGAGVVLNVGTTGRLSFRSAQTGCVGEGTIAPHGDGGRNVYQLTLEVAGCAGPQRHLNGRYDGLATTRASGWWDYDTNLRVWLSSSDRSPPVAVTMLVVPV